MHEALVFWKKRAKIGSEDFDKLSHPEKMLAFSVPGLEQGKRLNSIFSALKRALENGTPVRQFKKDCHDVFMHLGWIGDEEWKVDELFSANILLAYSIGNYKQLIDDKDTFPFWQYSAVEDSRARSSHLAMNGKVFRADHPVWDVWFPPNGRACRCSVIGLTERQAKRENITSNADDFLSPGSSCYPDLGFDCNPGKLFWGR